MSDFVNHARLALRMLLRHRRFSALAILSLSVAIALNTTMYSVLDNMVAPKIAMREPERLFAFWYFGDAKRKIPQRDKNEAYRNLSFPQGLTGSTRGELGEAYLQRGETVVESSIRVVLPNYFEVLGVRPSAGRLLSAADVDVAGRPVVLSERLWKQLFPDKATFEPATLYAGGDARTVVGLLSYESDFPGSNTDLWELPLGRDLPEIVPGLARLRPEVTPEQAGAELEVLRKRFAEVTGERNPADAGFQLLPATNRPFKVFGFHFALIGAVLSVLLIACANLANLQLARGISRSRELATRAAVGASRRDIVIQLMIESAWLAVGGLLLGAVLTAWGMKLVNAYVPPQVAEYVTHTQVSWRVLSFAVVVTLVCLTLMGLLPALKVSRVDVNELLKSGAGTGKSKSMRRQYGALVVTEVGLALSLLCAATLLMRAALVIITYDAGFATKGLLSTFVIFAPRGSKDNRTRQEWKDQFVAAAMSVPGVTSAAVTEGRSPKTHSIASEDAGGKALEHQLPPLWGYSIASPDYLRTMALTVVKGREFGPGEIAEPSVVIDERTAGWLWPGVDPIGRMVKLDSANAPTPWYRVVAVVRRTNMWLNVSEYDRNMAQARGLGQIFLLGSNDTTRLSQPHGAQRYTAFMDIMVRTTGEPMQAAVALRQALMDKGAGYASFPRTWEQKIGLTYLRAKHAFMASLFTLFSSISLALAALGIYAIIAHMVAQRTREFGVRIAVGASARDIRQLVLLEGNVLALAGIAAGLLMTWYNAKWLRAFLFDDDDRFDSRVFAVASLALFAIAWLASYIPARRAMRIDPVEALRND